MFDACRPVASEASDILTKARVVTPLIQETWEKELAAHPDPQFAAYIANGLKKNFRIGFQRDHLCKPALANMPTPQPNLVTECLQRELELGRISGDTEAADQSYRKKNKPNKWHLIVDLLRIPASTMVLTQPAPHHMPQLTIWQCC